MDAAPVYLDFAATTPVRREVLDVVEPYFSLKFGNPSSLYVMAEEARNAVAEAREQCAGVLKCKVNEVVFTSGGTESDNAAVKGGAQALAEMGRHIVVSAVEHPAVREAAEQLGRWGWDVDVVPVDGGGRVDPAAVYGLIRHDTTLVSVMMVNNELGTVQDIAGISARVRERVREFDHNIIMHTDAAQAAGKLDLDVDALGVDMMSLSGHKVYAPKGVGVLYVRRGTPFEPLLAGGGQERQRRSGTENVAAVAGMGKALELAEAERSDFMERAGELSERLRRGIERSCPDAVFNGDGRHRVPSILNVSFPGIVGEALLINLDFAGFAASSGSACSSASLEPSQVLVAIGRDADTAVSSIRFSLGLTTTRSEIDALLGELPGILERTRQAG